MSDSGNKSILKNSIFNVLSRGFNVLYPLVISAYLSHIFGAAGMGKIMFAINIVTYFTLAASLGIPNYAIRVIAKNRDSRKLTSKNFSELASIILKSSIISSILYYVIILFVYRGDSESFKIAAALGLMVITNITNYDWLFEAEEDFKYLAIRSIIIKTCAIILIFTLVHSKEDMVLYAFLYTGITVANNLWNAISFKKYATISFRNVCVNQHISPILVLFSSAIATDVYVLLDSTMLGVLADPKYLGYYSNSSRFVRASFGIMAAVTGVFNPRLNYLYGQEKRDSFRSQLQKFYDSSMFIAIPVFVGIWTLAPQVICILFGNDFLPGILTLRILAPLVVVFSLATVFGHVCLIIYHKEKQLLFATIIGAVVNFMFNLILIPNLYHNGVAIASVVCEVLVTVIIVLFSIKIVSIHLINRSLIISLFASIVMGSSIILLRLIVSNILLYFIVALFVGFVIYYILSCVFGHEIPLYLNNKLKAYKNFIIN